LADWDVFHSDRLEVERGLSTAAVRAALGRGDLVDDDLIRPSGTATPWARIVDMPALPDEPAGTPTPPPPDPVESFAEPGDLHNDPGERFSAIFDDNDDNDDDAPDPAPLGGEGHAPSLEVVTRDNDLHADADADHDDGDEADPQEEDEAAAEFTLARGSAETVEELDLAAMVDVAFQLVLFFLVTATTVLYKSLEVPRPNPENRPAAAAAQGKSRSLDDLKETYILVEIDPAGAVKVDNEPIAADPRALAGRLRALRERTGRKAMLLSADFSTPHRSAVLAYDAANEVGLGIAIARPRPAPVGAGAAAAARP